jgi:hypothetical protein
MGEDVYRKLQEHLDQRPMEYPATKSGVEIDILKKLFAQKDWQERKESKGKTVPRRLSFNLWHLKQMRFL